MKRASEYIAICLGIVTLFLCGGVTLARLVWKRPLFLWTEGDPGMAVTTAVCLGFLALAVIVLAASVFRHSLICKNAPVCKLFEPENKPS